MTGSTPAFLDPQEFFWRSLSETEQLKVDAQKKKILTYFGYEFPHSKEQSKEDDDDSSSNSINKFTWSRHKLLSLRLILLNLVFLLLVTIIVAGDISPVPGAKDYLPHTDFHQALVSVGIWIFIDFIFLIFLVLAIWRPSIFTQYELDPFSVWCNLAYVSVSIITMTTVADVIDHDLVLGKDCYVCRLLNKDRDAPVLDFIMFQYVLDLIQMGVFSILPMPSNVFRCLQITNALHQMLRVNSCAYLSGQDINFIGVYRTLLTIIPMQFIIATSVHLLFYENQNNKALGKKTADDKNMIIFLLSTDMKKILQQIVQVVSSFSSACDTITNANTRVMTVIDYEAQLLNEYLVIAKMYEGRFEFRCNCEVNIQQLIDSLMLSIFEGSFESYLVVEPLYASKGELARFRTDRETLTILLRYLFLYVRYRRSDVQDNSNSDSFAELPHSAAVIPRLAVTLLTSDSKTNTNDSIKSPGTYSTARHQESWHIQLRLSLNSGKVQTSTYCENLLYTCNTVISSIGGTFVVDNDSIFLSTVGNACSAVTAEYHHKHKHIPGPRNAHQCSVIQDEEKEEEEKGEEEDGIAKVDRDKRYEDISGSPKNVIPKGFVGVLLDDNDLAMSIIERLDSLDQQNVAFLGTGTNGYIDWELAVKLDVIILSSLSKAKELRGKGFTGIAVLLSGELQYLDMTTLNSVDYGLPIPCTHSSLDSLDTWLTSKLLVKDAQGVTEENSDDESTEKELDELCCEEERLLNSAVSSDSIGNEVKSVVKSLWEAITGDSGSLNETASKCDDGQSFLKLAKIPANMKESYARWRFINPTDSILYIPTSNTNVILMYFLYQSVHDVFHYIMKTNNTDPIAYNGFLLPFACFVLLSRQMIYKYISKSNTGPLYSILAWVCVVFMVVLSVFGASGVRISSSQDGKSFQHIVLLTTFYIRNLFFIPHLLMPYPAVVISLNVMRMYVSVLLWTNKYGPVVFSSQISMLLEVTLSFLFFASWIIEYHFEHTRRLNFLERFAIEQKKTFIDKFGSICMRECGRSLARLKMLKLEWIRATFQATLHNELNLDSTTLFKLSSFHVSQLQITDLITMLKFNLQKDEKEKEWRKKSVLKMVEKRERSEVANATEWSLGYKEGIFPEDIIAVLVPAKIKSIVVRVALSLKDTATEVYMVVDPALMYIRVNLKLFTSVINNMLQYALKNLAVHADDKETQDVVICITPQKSKTPIPFHSIHPMLITVLDSSRRQTKGQAGVGADPLFCSRYPECWITNCSINQPLQPEETPFGLTFAQRTCIHMLSDVFPDKSDDELYSSSRLNHALYGYHQKALFAYKPVEQSYVYKKEFEANCHRVKIKQEDTLASLSHITGLEKDRKSITAKFYSRSIALMFSANTDESSRLCNLLADQNWQHAIVSTEESKINTLLHYDVILLDNNATYVTLSRKSCKISEFITRLRHHGYEKLIVVLYDSDSEDMGILRKRIDVQESTYLELARPLAKETIKLLATRCDYALLCVLLRVDEDLEQENIDVMGWIEGHSGDGDNGGPLTQNSSPRLGGPDATLMRNKWTGGPLQNS